MKKIIILVSVIFLVWFLCSILSVQQAKNRKEIILSPSTNKSVEFVNSIGTSQLLMNFHKNLIVGGSNIVSGDFSKNKIRLKWKDDNTLIFEYPKGTKLNNKEHELYFFGEITNVIYKEITFE